MNDETLAIRLDLLRERRDKVQKRRDESMARYMADEIDVITWLQTDADMGGRMQALTYAIAIFGGDD